MALEKRLLAVSQFLAADGTIQGIATVLDASGFYTKQQVSLTSNTQPLQSFQVMRVNGPTEIVLMPVGGSLSGPPANISMYLAADVSLLAAAEQNKTRITPDEIIQAVYEKDPAVAIRTKLVDTFGRDWSASNPLPVNATINIPSIDVNLDAFTKVPPDNVLGVGSEDGTLTGVKHAQKIDSDSNLHVLNMAQLVPKIFDDIQIIYSSIAGQDVATTINYYMGGPLIATLAISYDSNANITRAQRTFG